MLNVDAYLPSNEQYHGIVDTVSSDVTDIGELANQAGIPEEMIVVADEPEQSEETDGVKEDGPPQQDTPSEPKDDESEKPEFTTGDSSENTNELDDVEDEESDEDKTSKINYAIEAYDRLVVQAGENLTHQAAAFLSIGMSRLQKRLGVNVLGLEDFDVGPNAVRLMASSEIVSAKLKELSAASATFNVRRR